MSAIDRAAEICDPWAIVDGVDEADGTSYRSIVARSGRDIAEALAAADPPLLVTDEIQALIDAVVGRASVHEGRPWGGPEHDRRDDCGGCGRPIAEHPYRSVYIAPTDQTILGALVDAYLTSRGET